MTFCNKRSVDQQNSTLDIIDKQFFKNSSKLLFKDFFIYVRLPRSQSHGAVFASG